jgi:cellobiose PTS system EIIB component
MRIMLACALGMSTGMLVQKMKKYAIDSKKDYKIWAVDQNKIKDEIGKFDVLLLGPQVSFLLDDAKKAVGDKATVAVIKPTDYGRMDGAGVVKFAEDLYRNFYCK